MTHDPSESLFFIHVPKSGGLSLYDVIRSVYGRKMVLATHDGNFIDAFETWKRIEKTDRGRVYYGHFPFGAHQIVNAKPRYLTMLRDPVDRVVSLYYYLRQSSTHPAHLRAKQNTLMEFVLRYPEFSNQQSRFLAGFGIGGKSPPNIAETAIKNSHHFLAVGLTSKFDASLVLFAHRLGWKRTPFYSRLNSSNRISIDAISAEERFAIQEVNAEDIKVYNFYEKRFLREQKAIPFFDDEVAKFSSFNARLTWLYRIPLKGRNMLYRIRNSFT
jgi:hypothetical protein